MRSTPTQLGKYELQVRLGHGGVAEVWKALDTQLQRFVAIKLLKPNLREDPNFLTRFQREAQFIARLHHPNIVQIHDFQVYQPDEDDEDTIPIGYMVMDYVEGQTLSSYIQATSNQGQIPTPTELVNLFTSISLGVDYAHQNGVIHRDIKPANILLDSRNTTVNPMGEPVLTDFGVAKMLSALTSTLTGAQLSTPLYISPEQATGYPGNERSDLYALGVMLYEMTTGILPFRANTAHEVLQLHINALPVRPELVNSRIPPALSQVIMRSLAKDPSDRFASASALTAALAEALLLPVPENLIGSGYLPDSGDLPTRWALPPTPAVANTPADASPSRPVSGAGSATPFLGFSDAGSFAASQRPVSGAGSATPFLGFSDAGSVSPSQGPVSGAGSVAPFPGPVSNPGSANPSQGPVSGAGSTAPFQWPVSNPGSATPSQGPMGVTPSQGPVSGSGSATSDFTPAMLYAASTPARPAPPPIPPSVPPSQPSVVSKRPRGWLPAAIILLLLVLIGSGLGSYFLLFKPVQPLSPSSIVGQAYYLSSGQLNPPTAQGIADQIQVDLQNVPAPKSGDSYYVWLLGDKQPDTHADLIGPRPLPPPILLTNSLPVNNGTVHFFYDGSKTQYNNLIATTSRLLITEQPAGQNAQAPSTNRADWRYYAEIPQDQIPGDSAGFSALTHIRHLFYNETNIKVLGLNGGLDFWMSRNAEKIVEWSVSARDDWAGNQTTSAQAALMTNLFLSILDYLDGSLNVHIDAPGAGLAADSITSRVSLLSVVPDQLNAANLEHNPPGYLDHVMLHVGQVGKAIDINSQTRQTTVRILDALNRAENLLQGVRQDVIKLYQIRNNLAQIQQASTQALLDDMTTKALYAYIGQVDPTTDQVQPAVLQAHYDIQQLATLNVTSQLPQSL
jgi:serine/threonine protein kinase